MTALPPDRTALDDALEALREGLADAPLAVGILHGPDHVVRFANPRLLEFFGGRDLVGRPVREAAPELVADGWPATLDRVYSTGEGVTVVAAPATAFRDGKQVTTFHDVTLQPVRGADGAIAGVCVAGVEVTAQVAARDAAEREGERFRTFVDSLEAVVWEGAEVAPGSGDVELDYVSGHAERMFGRSVDRWLGGADIWAEILHPDDRDATLDRARRERADGRDHELEYRALAADGRVVWVREIVHARRDEDGHRRYSGVMVDITVRKEAETLAQAVIDAAPEGFALYDTDLRYVRVNAALAEINGLPPEAHPGRTVEEVVPDLPPEAVLEPLRRVLETGRPVVDLEVSGATAASPGDRRTWLVSYFPVRDAAGEIVRLAAIITDITERKRAEERASLFAELAASLDEVVGLEERLRRLERVIVPRFADACSVSLAEPGEASDPGEPTVVAPLFASGRVIGHLTARRSRAWTDHEAALVEEIAQRAAAAIEAASLFESERAARGELARLQAVTAALSEALTPADVAGAVIDEGMAWVGASMAAVWQLGADEAALELIGHRGWAERSQRVPMQRIDLAASLPVPDAVRSRRPVWLPDRAAKEAAYPALASRAVGTSPDALYVVPLVAARGPVGAIALCFDDPARLDAGTSAFTTALAAQCAQALERARLFESEREIATVLQRSLLPASMPVVPGVQFAVRYLPAAGLEAGGDFYEAIELPQGAVGLAVGDVVGRGASAAATMGQLRAALRAFALQGDPPATVLNRLSDFARTVDGALAATAAYGILDPASGEFRFCCAGHPYPIVTRADGASELLTQGRSVPLGVTAEPDHHEAVAHLEPGSTLLLYTDGAVERRGEHLDPALERLRAALGSLAGAPLDQLLDDVVARQDIGAPVDDVALLAVRVTAAGAVTREARLPADPIAVGEARAQLREWLATARVPADVQVDLLLASGEAIANAVEHAYAASLPGEVLVRMGVRGDELALTVRDAGSWRQGPSAPDRGRGFALMRALVDEVVVERHPDGTSVTLRRRLPARGEAGTAGPTRAGEVTGVDATGRSVTVRLTGDIDFSCAGAVGGQLSRLAAGGRLVADLSAVTHLDSSGLRMLIETTREAPGGLALVAPPGTPARRTIEVAGVEGVVALLDEPPGSA